MVSVDQRLKAELEAHMVAIRDTVAGSSAEIAGIVDAIVTCFRDGGTLLICGNGGSAADAQHVAAEFVNRYRFDRPALAALALTTDSSALTCIGNDSSFDLVFSRQVEALARSGDVIVGISTSGQSVNVRKALEAARAKGVRTVGFTGSRGAATMGSLCDLCLVVASADTGRIQEVHEFVWHVVCAEVEERLFGGART